MTHFDAGSPRARIARPSDGDSVTTRWIACHDCDLLQRLGHVPEGGRARCPRCGGVLRERRRESLERTCALALAASVLFVVANLSPILAFDMGGQETRTTLASGVVDLYEQGFASLAALVLVTTIAAPLVQILLLLYVLLPLRLGRVPWRMPEAFRALRRVQPWSMTEVFLLGTLVAFVKLAGMAEVVPGLALWSFVALMIVLAGAMASFDPHELWERVEARR